MKSSHQWTEQKISLKKRATFTHGDILGLSLLVLQVKEESPLLESPPDDFYTSKDSTSSDCHSTFIETQCVTNRQSRVQVAKLRPIETHFCLEWFRGSQDTQQWGWSPQRIPHCHASGKVKSVGREDCSSSWLRQTARSFPCQHRSSFESSRFATTDWVLNHYPIYIWVEWRWRAFVLRLCKFCRKFADDPWPEFAWEGDENDRQGFRPPLVEAVVSRNGPMSSGFTIESSLWRHFSICIVSISFSRHVTVGWKDGEGTEISIILRWSCDSSTPRGSSSSWVA